MRNGSRNIFDKTSNDHLNQPLFFGDPVSVARYDTMAYPIFDTLRDIQDSMFWRAEEIDMRKDQGDFKQLKEHEQEIWKQTLLRLITFDSIQGRGPMEVLNPIASVPELEVFIAAWNYFETIHSKAYTIQIRNTVSNPTEVIDEIFDPNNTEIVKAADNVSGYYNDLLLASFNNSFTLEEKKLILWNCLHAIAGLEAIRFYGGFVTLWSFAERGLLEGGAKIIRLIARDENVHASATYHMIRLMRKNDPDYQGFHDYGNGRQIIVDIANEEMEWIDHVFSFGNIFGVPKDSLKDYIRYRTDRELNLLGYSKHFDFNINNNPMKWTEHWTDANMLQVAPQESDKTEYKIGSMEIDKPDFGDVEL